VGLYSKYSSDDAVFETFLYVRFFYTSQKKTNSEEIDKYLILSKILTKKSNQSRQKKRGNMR